MKKKQKIKNLHIALKKKDVENRKAINLRTVNGYGYPIKTVKEQMKVIIRKNSVLDKLENLYGSQLKVQDNEINRLNIILNNYEVKLKITVKD